MDVEAGAFEQECETAPRWEQGLQFARCFALFPPKVAVLILIRFNKATEELALFITELGHKSRAQGVSRRYAPSH